MSKTTNAKPKLTLVNQDGDELEATKLATSSKKPTPKIIEVPDDDENIELEGEEEEQQEFDENIEAQSDEEEEIVQIPVSKKKTPGGAEGLSKYVSKSSASSTAKRVKSNDEIMIEDALEAIKTIKKYSREIIAQYGSGSGSSISIMPSLKKIIDVNKKFNEKPHGTDTLYACEPTFITNVFKSKLNLGYTYSKTGTDHKQEELLGLKHLKSCLFENSYCVSKASITTLAGLILDHNATKLEPTANQKGTIVKTAYYKLNTNAAKVFGEWFNKNKGDTKAPCSVNKTTAAFFIKVLQTGTKPLDNDIMYTTDREVLDRLMEVTKVLSLNLAKYRKAPAAILKKTTTAKKTTSTVSKKQLVEEPSDDGLDEEAEEADGAEE